MKIYCREVVISTISLPKCEICEEDISCISEYLSGTDLCIRCAESLVVSKTALNLFEKRILFKEIYKYG